MKNVIAILVFVFASTALFAQQISISEAPRAKENGTYNSYLFELPDVDKEQAIKDWMKFTAAYKGKTKYDRKSKLYFTDNAKMSNLSDGTVDVYARILEDKNPNKRTSVIVWFDLGDSYVSSETDAVKGAYAIAALTEYAMTTSKHHAESIVKAEEKNLASLERDLEKLKKDNKGYHKEIEKSKANIAKNEKNIEVNELDQKNKVKEIEAQKGAVGEAKDNAKKFN